MKKIFTLTRNFAVTPYTKFHKFYTLYIDKYEYRDNLYEDYFLSKVKKDSTIILKNAPEIIYVFWTGTNELTENRKLGLESIRKKSGVAVKLVTPDNLSDYIVDGYPLHPAYEYLSLIQKSDYLRCYFMLHHGGGYVDIKPCLDSWKNLFEKLNASNHWCLGKREKFVGGVPTLGGNIGADCFKYHNNLISNSGGFIYKPQSPIAKEWMDEINLRLDFYLPDLKKNPGDAFGSGNYPIPWAVLAGHIMAPLILKYHDKVITVNLELFSTKNYR